MEPGTKPAIFSSAIISRRRHPSRLPCGSLRSAWTGPGGDAGGFLIRENGSLQIILLDRDRPSHGSTQKPGAR